MGTVATKLAEAAQAALKLSEQGRILEATGKRLAIRNAAVRMQRDEQRRLEAKAKAFLIDQGRRIQARLTERNFKRADKFFDWDAEKRRFRVLVSPFIKGAWVEGFQFATKQVENIKRSRESDELILFRYDRLQEQTDDEFIRAQGAVRVVTADIALLAGQINDTTRKAIKDALNKVIAEGGGLAEAKSAIQAVFDVAPVRARAIAQTEIIRALNRAQRKVFQASGFMKDKNQKFRVFDFKVVDGKPVRIPGSGEFIEGPPVHTNCRCVVALDPETGLLDWIAIDDDRTDPQCIDLENRSQRAIAAAAPLRRVA